MSLKVCGREYIRIYRNGDEIYSMSHVKVISLTSLTSLTHGARN